MEAQSDVLPPAQPAEAEVPAVKEISNPEAPKVAIEDETLSILELKRQMEEERKQKLAAQYRKKIAEMIKHETELSKANALKVHSLLRTRLKEEKHTELLGEVERLVEDFRHHIERKDSIISQLYSYTQVAEDQRRRASKSHLDVLGQLQALFKERLSESRGDLESAVGRIRGEFEAELTAQTRVFEGKQTLLSEVLQASKERCGQAEDGIRREYQSRLDEIRNRGQESFNVMRLSLEERNAELQRHLIQAHEQYQANTEPQTHHFKVLLLKDQQSAREIARQQGRIEKLEQQVGQWKAKLQATSTEYGQRNSMLRAERAEVAKHFSKLKTSLSRFKLRERKRQTTMVATATELEETLEDQRSLAERVIRLAELCDRLETEAERVNVQDRLPPQVRAELRAAAGKRGNAVDPAASMMEGMRPLQKRLARVNLDKMALEREAQLLEHENRQLKDAMRRFLEAREFMESQHVLESTTVRRR
eukprot:gnl/Dysnectes_brevis/3988_a5199_380.p1 GENE.gnl/Dysnectes_brevis/3988_a5199_380~~gnl/Dysnectes_brevis/3988_a5199_380.p1  ORF type:complete len:479 (+),score=161.48 gnl/Dysnectes_brevis/3988_a5199_380:51-1487(+)